MHVQIGIAAVLTTLNTRINNSFNTHSWLYQTVSNATQRSRW